MLNVNCQISRIKIPILFREKSYSIESTNFDLPVQVAKKIFKAKKTFIYEYLTLYLQHKLYLQKVDKPNYIEIMYLLVNKRFI